MTRQIDCPQCGTKCSFSSENTNRPFCSERCRLVDLGEWASEGYKIESKTEIDEFDEYSTGMSNSEQPFTPRQH